MITIQNKKKDLQWQKDLFQNLTNLLTSETQYTQFNSKLLRFSLKKKKNAFQREARVSGNL